MNNPMTPQVQRILVGAGLRHNDEATMGFALLVTRATGASHLELYHCVPDWHYILGMSAEPARKVAEKARGRLEEIAASLDVSEGLRVAAYLEIGKVAPGLLERARAGNADLVCLGRTELRSNRWCGPPRAPASLFRRGGSQRFAAFWSRSIFPITPFARPTWRRCWPARPA